MDHVELVSHGVAGICKFSMIDTWLRFVFTKLGQTSSTYLGRRISPSTTLSFWRHSYIKHTTLQIQYRWKERTRSKYLKIPSTLIHHRILMRFNIHFLGHIAFYCLDGSQHSKPCLILINASWTDKFMINSLNKGCLVTWKQWCCSWPRRNHSRYIPIHPSITSASRHGHIDLPETLSA